MTETPEDDWEGIPCPLCEVPSFRFREYPDGRKICWKCHESGIGDFCEHFLPQALLYPRLRAYMEKKKYTRCKKCGGRVSKFKVGMDMLFGK